MLHLSNVSEKTLLEKVKVNLNFFSQRQADVDSIVDDNVDSRCQLMIMTMTMLITIDDNDNYNVDNNDDDFDDETSHCPAKP